jgi:GDP-L-fucose synthase
VDDLGEACVYALENWQPGPEDLQFLNVGTGVDLTTCETTASEARSSGMPANLISLRRNSWM